MVELDEVAIVTKIKKNFTFVKRISKASISCI